jgi:xylan 1,4-beta-xylosidase
VKARYVRYLHGHVGAANLAISDIRVFGSAGGKPPACRPA